VARLVTLRSQREIDTLFRQGKHLRGRWMKVVVLARDEPGQRVLVVAGKRVGPAVVRNRAKRRMREALRATLPALPEGCDVAMVAHAADIGTHALEQELRGLLRRAGWLGGGRG
jgi:ribonuclease P protein component